MEPPGLDGSLVPQQDRSQRGEVFHFIKNGADGNLEPGDDVTGEPTVLFAFHQWVGVTLEAV